MVCRKDSREVGRIPIADLRAVVLVNESVSISGSIMAALAESDAVMLHCKNFRPIGITLASSRTYDARTVLNQSRMPKALNAAIWCKLLNAKIANGLGCLKRIGACSTLLSGMFESRRRTLDESRCAREYWRVYFPQIGEYGGRRTPQSESSPANVFLNYGYGILGALIHRSIIVHGLSPLLGVNHKTYYKNTPLVYDVIEPFRAFVDLSLARFLETNGQSLRDWAEYMANFLREIRVAKGGGSVKLVDAVDFCASSLANAYKKCDIGELWVPYMDESLRRR